jgi:hypothetical protein
MAFKQNDIVEIRCEAQPGPLDDIAVTIETGAEVISGFVKREFVRHRGGKSYLVGKVVKVGQDVIEIQLPGSFFTSARGYTILPRPWAESNVERAV